MKAERAPASGLPAELLVVWAFFAVAALEIFATYWRLPASELYHVSGSGPTGGASRVLVWRGWTSRQIPNTLEPKASLAWGAIVLVAAVISAIAASSERRRPGTPGALRGLHVKPLIA
jgi:hypothetical protein